MNGIINVYKEKGYTSFDVCAKLRGILKQKKIGHTGTLDPEAEGVLPVCIGNATKLCDLLTDKEKEYETILRLGIVTDTQDMTGTVLRCNTQTVSESMVREAINHFVGKINQIPPMYSAIKINGKRLYEFARQGIEVERKSRTITIHKIEILGFVYDETGVESVQEVKMRIHCSKGTYIRTLCEDIGNHLGVGGCMKELLRIRVADFLLRDSLRLSEIEEYVHRNQISDICIPVDSIFPQYPKASTHVEYNKLLYNGNVLNVQELYFDLAEDVLEEMTVPIEEVNTNDNYFMDTQHENDNAGDGRKKSSTSLIKTMPHTYPDFIRAYDSFHRFIAIYQYEEIKQEYHVYKMFQSRDL